MTWTTPRTWVDGELVTATIMNAHVRDNLRASAPHLVVRKSATESVTASTTLQDDDHLVMALGANETWLVWYYLFISQAGSGGGEHKFGFSSPASCIYNMSSVWHTGAVVGLLDWDADATSQGILSNVAGAVFPIWGIIRNAGTAGNFQLRWAQNVSDADASRVEIDSLLYAAKLA